jgi:adenylosuccinate lyase
MDYSSYASPFSWRYGRAEMRKLFSERERRRLWRAVWVALAESQERSGLISRAEIDDIRAHADEIDVCTLRNAAWAVLTFGKAL